MKNEIIYVILNNSERLLFLAIIIAKNEKNISASKELKFYTIIF